MSKPLTAQDLHVGDKLKLHRHDPHTGVIVATEPCEVVEFNLGTAWVITKDKDLVPVTLDLPQELLH